MHVEIQLPQGTFYRSGDYLAILPINPRQTVVRALRRFQLPVGRYPSSNFECFSYLSHDTFLQSDTDIVIKGSGTKIPTNVPLSVQSVLSEFVELGQPATRKDIETLLKTGILSTEDKKALQWLATDGFDAEISTKRTSILDTLEKYPRANVEFGTFLRLLPALRTRQ
jgi:cytochrome P450 / NADPH-cytochrome P450 reductase